MAASPQSPPYRLSPSPFASYPPSAPACVLVPSHQLAIAIPAIWVSSHYLCLINSPSILNIIWKHMFPPHTPLSISSAFIYFILWLLQLWKSIWFTSETALQRAVTAFDMKDCNLSGLKYLIWVNKYMLLHFISTKMVERARKTTLN